MKTKFICVEPKSKKAVNRFHNLMNQFHSCKIEQETDDQIFLSSISGKYHFWMKKINDENWTIVK